MPSSPTLVDMSPPHCLPLHLTPLGSPPVGCPAPNYVWVRGQKDKQFVKTDLKRSIISFVWG